MRTPASEHVTLVEVLELTQPFEEFAAAVQAAARRLEVEGIKELVTLQFYADPASTEVGAILTFTDRNRMMKHIDMITGWEEFERFFATVKPVDVRVYGKLSAEAEEWVGHFGAVSKTFEDHGQDLYAELPSSKLIHRSAWRNCPKRVGGGCGVALRSTSTALFDPFWPPYASQVYAQSVARTPFRTVSRRSSQNEPSTHSGEQGQEAEGPEPRGGTPTL